MPDRTPEQRAYDRGVAVAELRAKTADHERHLDVINGSVARTVEELRKVRACLDELLGAQKTRLAVEEALRDTVTTAAAKQVTTRQFGVGVAMLVVAIVGLYFGAAG